MDAILEAFVNSQLANEPLETRMQTFHISLILAAHGFDIENPYTIRAIEIIHSYCEFKRGLDSDNSGKK